MCNTFKFLKCRIIKEITKQNKIKMVHFNGNENQSKSRFYDCLIGKSQQLNHIYGASLIDFSLTLNGGFNVLIYNVSLTLFFLYC